MITLFIGNSYRQLSSASMSVLKLETLDPKTISLHHPICKTNISELGMQNYK